MVSALLLCSAPDFYPSGNVTGLWPSFVDRLLGVMIEVYHGGMNVSKYPTGQVPLPPLTFLEDSSGGDWLFHSSTDDTEKSGEHSGLFRAQVGQCVRGWWTIVHLCSLGDGGGQLAERDRVGWTLRKEMEVDGGRREEDEGRNPIWIKGLVGRISRNTNMILHISEGCTSSNVCFF